MTASLFRSPGLLINFNGLSREVMVATSVMQGSSNELSSLVAVKRIYVNKTNEIHKRLNFIRLRWFPRS